MIKPKIRVAQNSDAKAIQEILRANHMLPEGLDWSEIKPYWIVAEYKDKIIGCTQILFGKPTGAIPELAVLPEYHASGVGIYLWRSAESLLAQAGCDGYIGITDNSAILDKLGDLGFTTIGEFTLIIKRLYRDKKANESISQISH